MVNALLYVDFIDRPKCHDYDYALMIVDALNAFCQVVPCNKACRKLSNTLGFVSMPHLFASTVTRILVSRETMAGTATYLPQWVRKFLSHNSIALDQTEYASA